MRMRKRIPLFLALAYICTACAKTSGPPTISINDIDWENFYNYRDTDTISQERIETGRIRYLEHGGELVEEAIGNIREEMQIDFDIYHSEQKEDLPPYYLTYSGIFEDGGYYVSKVPVTKYNNNLNRLWDCFTLYILDKETKVIGSAYIRELNDKKMKTYLTVLGEDDLLRAAERAPEREFIEVHAKSIPDYGIGGSEYTLLLGEDNRIYEYDSYVPAGITYDVGRKVDGDAFHALPEEMRFSYNEIVDRENLVWVEFENRNP